MPSLLFRPAPVRIAATLFALFAVATAAGPARAASLDVRPTMVRIGPSQPTVALTLESADPEEHSYQVRLFRWVQHGAEQTLEPSQDLIANPPIVRIRAGSRQMVRLGLRSREYPRAETAYRLVLDELPSAESIHSGTLSVLLRLTLPVFVRDGGEPPPASLAGSVFSEGGRLHAIVHNDGSVTERVTRASLGGRETAELKYILPGGQTEFVFAQGGASGTSSLALETDRGPLTIPLTPVAASRVQTASTGLPVLSANGPAADANTSIHGRAPQP